MSLKLPAAEAVLDLLPDAVCMVDPQGRFRYVNAAFERILGYRGEQVLGHQMIDLVHPDDRQATLQAAAHIMGGQAQPHFRNRYMHRDGHPVDIQWSARWLPEYGLRLAVGHEVTALRGAERTLEHLANHDPLTGLANRARLWEVMETYLTQADERGGGLVVLYLDLDGFKRINDDHGHAVGDHVLREVARALCKAIRQSDLVARVGGDEFVVVLPQCSGMPVVLGVAAKLRGAVKCLLTPLPLDVSIGVARHPHDGESVDALLRHADAAMYEQKASRRAGETSDIAS